MKYQFLLFVATALIVVGCSNSSDPGTGGPTPFKHTIPGVGSTFEYEYTSDTTFTVVTKVIAQGLEIQGKKNVVRFETTALGQTSSTLLAYESDGDVSELSEPDMNWIKQPFESKKEAVVTITDSSETRKDIYVWTATPYKENKINVGGKMLAGYQIKNEIVARSYDGNGDLLASQTYNSFKTWSHEVGMWMHDSAKSYRVILTSYTLK